MTDSIVLQLPRPIVSRAIKATFAWRYFEAGLMTLASLTLSACATANRPAQEPNTSEEVIAVTLCQVISDPARYNHKLIKVSGNFYHGFESSFFGDNDSACSPFGDAVWLEYGGRKGAGTAFAGGPSSDRRRS